MSDRVVSHDDRPAYARLREIVKKAQRQLAQVERELLRYADAEYVGMPAVCEVPDGQ